MKIQKFKIEYMENRHGMASQVFRIGYRLTGWDTGFHVSVRDQHEVDRLLAIFGHRARASKIRVSTRIADPAELVKKLHRDHFEDSLDISELVAWEKKRSTKESSYPRSSYSIDGI